MSVWERSWNMNAGSNGLKKTQFSLERHQTDGIVYYTMKIEKLGAATDASEAEAWSNCRLVQRGLYPMPWSPVKSLKPFDGTDITESINEWLDRVSAVTLRLEGELEIVGEPRTRPNHRRRSGHADGRHHVRGQGCRRYQKAKEARPAARSHSFDGRRHFDRRRSGWDRPRRSDRSPAQRKQESVMLNASTVQARNSGRHLVLLKENSRSPSTRTTFSSCSKRVA